MSGVPFFLLSSGRKLPSVGGAPGRRKIAFSLFLSPLGENQCTPSSFGSVQYGCIASRTPPSEQLGVSWIRKEEADPFLPPPRWGGEPAVAFLFPRRIKEVFFSSTLRIYSFHSSSFFFSSLPRTKTRSPGPAAVPSFSFPNLGVGLPARRGSFPVPQSFFSNRRTTFFLITPY